jgi:hypothetical protein
VLLHVWGGRRIRRRRIGRRHTRRRWRGLAIRHLPTAMPRGRLSALQLERAVSDGGDVYAIASRRRELLRKGGWCRGPRWRRLPGRAWRRCSGWARQRCSGWAWRRCSGRAWRRKTGRDGRRWDGRRPPESLTRNPVSQAATGRTSTSKPSAFRRRTSDLAARSRLMASKWLGPRSW